MLIHFSLRPITWFCSEIANNAMLQRYIKMTKRVQFVEKILDANDQLAAQNRSEFDQAGVFSINLMASPGAGKTSLILETIRGLQDEMQIGVIEGDTMPVTIDSDKVVAAGTRAVQINTGGTATWMQICCTLVASIPEGDAKPFKYPNIYYGLEDFVVGGEAIGKEPR